MAHREHGFSGIDAVTQSGLYALRAQREFSTADTPEQYLPDVPIDWQQLTLCVEVDVHGRRVWGTATYEGQVCKAEVQRLRFDADGLQVLRAFDGDGQRLPCEHDGKTLWIALGGARTRGTQVRVSIDFDTREPRAGFYFVLPDADHPDRIAHAWTQGQDEDSKFWFPCHDAPNHKLKVAVVVTVPPGMVAFSNGILRDIHTAADPGKRVYDWQIARPIPTYLLTLVVGPFVEVVQQTEPVLVSYAVLPGRIEDGERSFGRTPDMVALYAQLTGVPYPYEKYGQVAVGEFVFGGMENASMTTQTDLTLHDARAHLDFSSEPLVAHELAHQWFGDLVTCRSWSHGWLNEGFATYFEQLWQEHAHGPDEFDYARLSAQRAYLAEDAGRYRRTIVTNRYQEPIDLFDAHLYEKGGAVLHMLRSKLGDATFFGAVGAYLRAFADDVVETQDLRRAFERHAGVDLGRFFAQWVESGRGHPELKVSGSWDAELRQYKLTLEQTQDLASAPLFALDVAVELVFDDGQSDRRVLSLDRKQQQFWLTLPAQPALVQVDPRGDVLATWDLGLPEPQLRALLARGTAVAVRIVAAHALAGRPNGQNVQALRETLSGEAPWMVHAEVARALGKVGSAAAWDALAAAADLPHPKARRAVREATGRFPTAAAGALLAERLGRGDVSVLVEAETAKALGATRAAGAYEALVAALDRESWNETVRVGVLDGLAALQDPRGIEVAAGYLHPRFATLLRCAAIRCLCQFTTEPARVVEVLRPWTADTSFRFAFNLASSLGGLGDPRVSALLQAVISRAADGRVHKRAHESLAALRAGLGAGKQVDGLRGDVDGLRNQMRDLADRLDKAEQLRGQGA
ncbi:MAG: DUF3458 domain-containing protein [Deltaproteobacteria bacterium]|nr:DUF3458 domain-containing protein [Deltaproteobacteria bacterium]